MNRMDPSLDPGENILRPPEILPLSPQESKIIKEENDSANEVDVFPSELVTPKDEEEEEQIDRQGFKKEDEVDKEDRDIKDEPIYALLSNQKIYDSSLNFNMLESMEEDGSRMEMEEEELQIIESSEEGDLPTTSARSKKTVKSGDPIDSLDPKYIQTIREWVNIVTDRGRYEGERKERLKAAVYAVCVREMSGTAAASKFNVPQPTIWTNVLQVREGLKSGLPPQANTHDLIKKKIRDDNAVKRNADSSLNFNILDSMEDSGLEMEQQVIESSQGGDLPTTSTRSTKKCSLRDPIDALDSDKIQTIRDWINVVTSRSRFKGESKEQLKSAVFAVCIGELNGREASKKFDLHQPTISYNVLQVREGLASGLPPQANSHDLVRKKIRDDKALKALLRLPEILPLPPQQSNDIKKEVEGNQAEIDRQEVKNEDEEVYKEDREIKEEPIDDSLWNQRKDESSLNFNMFDSMEEDDSRMEMEEEEYQALESSDEEELSTASERSSACAQKFKFGVPLDPLDAEKIQSIRDAIIAVIKGSRFEGQRRTQLEAALFAICVGELSGRAASKNFNIHCETLRVYTNLLRQLLELRSTNPSANLANFEPGDPLDPLDTERTQTIRDYINETVTHHSTYEGEREEHLKAALYAVCIGELNLTAASKKFELPYSMINDKMKIVRIGLGSILPPEAKPYVRTKKNIRDDKTIQIDARDILDPLDEENQNIRDVIWSIVKHKPKTTREQFKEAIFAVCTEELSVIEASKKYHVKYRWLLGYVQKSLNKLGRPCLQTTKKERRIDEGKKSVEEETVTIDGITVPNSIDLLNVHLAIGRLNYSKAKPFQGTKAELREKLITILHTFNIRIAPSNIVDAVMHVYVEGHTISEACQMYKVTDKMFTNCFKVVKVFVDFAKSPCSREICKNTPRSRFLTMQFPQEVPMNNGEMEPYHSLPIQPEDTMNERKITKEEMKEEPIEPILRGRTNVAN